MDKFVLGLYAAFLCLGAFFGWKAGSKISLISGLVSGVLVFVSCYVTAIRPKSGLLMAVGIGIVLVIVFGLRFLKTQQWMPSGMLLIITALFLLYCLSRYLKLS